MDQTPLFDYPLVSVFANTPELQHKATQLAKRLHLPLIQSKIAQTPLILVITEERLELHTTDPDLGGPVYVDFVKGKVGYRHRHGGGIRQPLARAVGLKGNVLCTVLDATPGLGQDAYVLASLGAKVEMVERSSVVVELLTDAMNRPGVCERTLANMILTHQDARLFMEEKINRRVDRPDVIYLDPMYPHRKMSALVKKEMRRLRVLVGDDEDAPSLLSTALICAKKRVVVKRSLQAEPLIGQPPTMAITTKKIRFDVYLVTHEQK